MRDLSNGTKSSVQFGRSPGAHHPPLKTTVTADDHPRQRVPLVAPQGMWSVTSKKLLELGARSADARLSEERTVVAGVHGPPSTIREEFIWLVSIAVLRGVGGTVWCVACGVILL